MTERYYLISADWLRRTGESIGARNGVGLKDCLARAEAGEAVTLHNDSAATMRSLTRHLGPAIADAMHSYAQKHPVPCNPRTRPQTAAELRGEEQRQCLLAAARVAVTGALVVFQRENRKVVQHVVSSPTTAQIVGGASAALPTGADGAEARELERSCHDTLLKGLLYAFEAFVSMHAMNRDHYPPRTGNKTVGTVGWDTLVLLHFVHHIPQIARDASGAVIDEVTGELVRSWRKLLVALQTVDANEAAEHSRRRGTLALVNGLLIIMFQRYNTAQCTVFLNAVDHAESVAERLGDRSKSILAPSQHMVSEVVTHYYYKGRMHLYNRLYTNAHADLQQAYHLLPPEEKGTAAHNHNKQRVRFFLIVAGLLCGRRTPQPILDADPQLADMFAPLVAAIEHGNPVEFHHALEQNGATWRRRGVYLLFQHEAKLLCYLVLLARVHAAVGAVPGKDSSRITLANLLAGYHSIVGEERETERRGRKKAKSKKQRLQALASPAEGGAGGEGEEEEGEIGAVDAAAMDDDRLALWVVKLIARGFVRGYLSHEHKTIVLSKAEPFPMLTPKS